MKKAKVVLNEQHTLMEEQTKLLNEKFGEDGWEILPVPASGWTKEQMEEVLHKGEWGKDFITMMLFLLVLSHTCLES